MQQVGEDRYFYLHDRMGSTRQVINASATVVNSYTYDPWGNAFATETSEAISNHYQFANYHWDSTIGMYYLNARWYDPAILRFTGRDPVNGKFTEPMTLHPYLYCLNNPINYKDLEGKMGTAVLDTTTGRTTLMIGAAAIAMYGIQTMNSGHVLSIDMISSAIETGKQNLIFNAITMSTAIQELFNAFSNSRSSQAKKHIDGAMNSIREHLDKFKDYDPGDYNNDPRNDWRKHIQKALNNIKKYAERLNGKAKDDALKNIDDVIQEMEKLSK
jgi:RHS repeat-associated protein